MADKHVRRGGAEYAQALADLLPTGPAWPRELDTVLMKVVDGLAQIWGMVDGSAADLLERETDPRFTTAMLADWERAFGLPDPCVAEPLTLEDRRRALIRRMTEQGGQSRAFFIGLAAYLGYSITIWEYSPFMCGVSRCGDTRDTGADGEQYRWQVGPPEIRFYWRVFVGQVRLTWFRMGTSQVGVDHHLEIARATDLECLFRRYKPAQTEIVFDYSGVTAGDAFAGTP